MKRTKRTLSLLIALAMVLLSATTAFADVFHARPLNCIDADANGFLENEYTTQYTDENGLLITEETRIYDYPSLSRAEVEKKKKAVKVYTVSSDYDGDLLTITLDADFYYITDKPNSVRCPRYYSSYAVHREEYLISYKESDMSYSTGEKGAKVQTTYPVSYRRSVDGSKVSKNIVLWVYCDNWGRISTS